MPALIIVATIAAGAVLGSPKQGVANLFWADDATPWETVDAFYYPNKANLTVDVRRLGLGSVDECRSWARAQAMRHNDHMLMRSSYECGVGYLETFGGGLRVYRRTVR